jgi:hypothetical protein
VGGQVFHRDSDLPISSGLVRAGAKYDHIAVLFHDSLLQFGYNIDMEIINIIKAISSKRFRVTAHARKEAAEDRLKFKEIYQSVENGMIIEDYPSDKPYGSTTLKRGN